MDKRHLGAFAAVFAIVFCSGRGRNYGISRKNFSKLGWDCFGIGAQFPFGFVGYRLDPSGSKKVGKKKKKKWRIVLG